MYKNAICPSRLFSLVLSILSVAGAILWIGCLVDVETPAFDGAGRALLGAALSSFVLCVLFLRRARWARAAASILLHMLMLALLAAMLPTLLAAETAMETAAIISITFLVAGLLFTGVLGLHSEGMRRDFAGESLSAPRTYRHLRKYLLAVAGCTLLILVIAAWRIVPLLAAEPTVTVDYLSQANRATQPANYDPNRNAAPHYEKLLSEFIPLPEVLKEVWKSWPADLEPNEYKTLEEWATLNEPILPVLKQAAQCPYYWFEMKSSAGALSGIHIPQLSELRDCAWGAILLAKFRAHRGEMSDAMQLLADVHMMGVHWAERGTLLEQLTGVAVCELVYDALFAVLEHCETDKDLLEQALGTLAPRMSRINVPRFCEVERLYGLDSIQRMFTDNGKGDGRLIPERLYTTKKNRASLYTSPISYLEAVWICATHPGRRETTCLSESYFALVPELARETPWELHARDTSYEEQMKETLCDNYYLQDGLAAIGQCIRIGWRSKATGEATMTVLAAFLYRAREGRLAESLKQLVDAGLLKRFPMDPYSESPLVYRVTKDGFALYSVGEDFVDNDGSPCDWSDKTGGDRVFWPVPKPKDLWDMIESVDDE